MRLSQSERLSKVLMSDKSMSPQRILPALKSDIRDILREYSEIYEDIHITISDAPTGYDLFIVGKIIRFK